jgi:hypothetical protein
MPGQAGGVICLEVRNSKPRRRTINLVEKRKRLTAIYSFIEYTSADHLSRLHLWPDRWSHYSSVRDNCLQWLRSRYEAIKKPSRAQADDFRFPESLPGTKAIVVITTSRTYKHGSALITLADDLEQRGRTRRKRKTSDI